MTNAIKRFCQINRHFVSVKRDNLLKNQVDSFKSSLLLKNITKIVCRQTEVSKANEAG